MESLELPPKATRRSTFGLGRTKGVEPERLRIVFDASGNPRGLSPEPQPPTLKLGNASGRKPSRLYNIQEYTDLINTISSKKTPKAVSHNSEGVKRRLYEDCSEQKASTSVRPTPQRTTKATSKLSQPRQSMFIPKETKVQHKSRLSVRTPKASSSSHNIKKTSGLKRPSVVPNHKRNVTAQSKVALEKKALPPSDPIKSQTANKDCECKVYIDEFKGLIQELRTHVQDQKNENEKVLQDQKVILQEMRTHVQEQENENEKVLQEQKVILQEMKTLIEDAKFRFFEQSVGCDINIETVSKTIDENIDGNVQNSEENNDGCVEKPGENIGGDVEKSDVAHKRSEQLKRRAKSLGSKENFLNPVDSRKSSVAYAKMRKSCSVLQTPTGSARKRGTPKVKTPRSCLSAKIQHQLQYLLDDE